MDLRRAYNALSEHRYVEVLKMVDLLKADSAYLSEWSKIELAAACGVGQEDRAYLAARRAAEDYLAECGSIRSGVCALAAQFDVSMLVAAQSPSCINKALNTYRDVFPDGPPPTFEASRLEALCQLGYRTEVERWIRAEQNAGREPPRLDGVCASQPS